MYTTVNLYFKVRACLVRGIKGLGPGFLRQYYGKIGFYDKWRTFKSFFLLLLHVAPPLLFTVTFPVTPTNSLAVPSPSFKEYHYNKHAMWICTSKISWLFLHQYVLFQLAQLFICGDSQYLFPISKALPAIYKKFIFQSRAPCRVACASYSWMSCIIAAWQFFFRK